jgi:hypothetical protein
MLTYIKISANLDQQEPKRTNLNLFLTSKERLNRV